MEDYFAFFNLPEAYHLDTAELKRRYMQRSRELHPDFHTQADSATQARMLQQSSLNNQAWRTLSDPQLRLQYLFRRYELLDSEGADLTGRTLPPHFLMEVMELNELLLDDPAATQNRIAALKADIETQLAQALQAFDAATDPAARKAALQSALSPYLQQKYLVRLEQQVG